MRDYKETEKTNVRGDQRGAAIVLSILALLLITVLGVALISTGMISENISENSRQQTEAYFISEAGLTHAMKLLAPEPTFNYDAILGNANWLSGHATYPITAGGHAFGNGTYTVTITDDPADADGNASLDSNDRLMVTSVGSGRDGSAVTTEAVISVSTFPAILVNSPLEISGNPVVDGSGGIIHANGTITTAGNPCADQYISSTGTVTNTGAINIAACPDPQGPAGAGLSNQAPIVPPLYDITATFRHRADYIMGTDGRVTNQAGTVLHNSATQGNDWNWYGSGKWTWKGSTEQTWEFGGSSMEPLKTYYSQGNMTIGSDFGGPDAAAIKATFVAEGFIDVKSNPYATAHLDNKYAFMAGTDLVISGNPSSGFSSQGIHYCRHQVKLNGNPNINGVILARDDDDVARPLACGSSCNPVPRVSGRMIISGDARVNYDGGLIDGQPLLISWREIRN